jgi:hypothetical protein
MMIYGWEEKQQEIMVSNNLKPGSAMDIQMGNGSPDKASVKEQMQV